MSACFFIPRLHSGNDLPGQGQPQPSPTQPPQPLPQDRRLSWPEFATALLLLMVFAVWAYLTAPVAGDFAWSDAPRHALNGIFVRDLIAQLPAGDPRAYAIDYYLRYPALTILFYPPLFSAVLALMYQLFGFSHAVAQATVIAFYLLLGGLGYALARRWLGPALSMCAALLLIGAPELTVWARQVMLDIPAYALLVAMALAFTRYLDTQRPRDLCLSALLLLAALYTKQTPLFVFAALAAGLLTMPGRPWLRDKRLWLAGLITLLLLMPLLYMLLRFGQINTASALGSARPDTSRLSLAAWVYYARIMPAQIGWATPLLALVYLLGCLWRPDWRLPRAPFAFLLTWLVAGYLFFSFIMVREPRHDLMALLPLFLFAALALRHLSPPRWAGAISVAAALLAGGQLVAALHTHQVPYVRGYEQASAYVQTHAPSQGVVMFSGSRDGTFIFNVRAGQRQDLSVARADKLLFRVAIERERGLEDRQVSRQALLKSFGEHAIRYVVYDPGFWQDLPSMAVLDALLKDEQHFEQVQTIALSANFEQADKQLLIYRFRGELRQPPLPLSAELVGAGIKLQK
jgi:4-amino-4-deoxy-L-arabinose transferase-like glycosyltransferase